MILINTIGLPRSGKTTLCAKLAKTFNWTHVSRDQFRLQFYGKLYDPKLDWITKGMWPSFLESLLKTNPVVINDECNITRQKYSVPVYYLPVQTCVSLCIERAQQTGQERLIPVINEMNKNLSFTLSSDELASHREAKRRLTKLYTLDACSEALLRWHYYD